MKGEGMSGVCAGDEKKIWCLKCLAALENWLISVFSTKHPRNIPVKNIIPSVALSFIGLIFAYYILHLNFSSLKAKFAL